MLVDWEAVQKALVPAKDYEDLSRRWRVAFSYPFICDAFNFTLPDLAGFTGRLLGGDARGRYDDYAALLVRILKLLQQGGVQDVLDLTRRVDTREKLAAFAGQSGIHAHEIVLVLKYLVYWVIPAEKYLSGLVRAGSDLSPAIKTLSELGIRTNLEMLQQGITATGRQALAAASGLPEQVIWELVNRADFSRMPWASKATISNIIGAGYTSLAELANAEPERLYADFFRYGQEIGKNLKLGNEIENSHRIAKILPRLVDFGAGLPGK